MSRHLDLALILFVSNFSITALFAGEYNDAKPAESTISVSAALDRHLTEEVLNRLPAGQQLAPRTSDEIFLRRIYLDLVGVAPTPEGVKQFTRDTAADKRSAKIAALLSDRRYGVNVGNYWRDVLLGRQNAVGEGPTVIVETLEAYLTKQFNDNVPWDQLVRSFIQAQGPIGDHGETAIYIAQRLDAVEIAGEMSRLFLGIQIQCAECHDHPTDRWKRQQFHEFAAFFPRVGIKRFERMAGKGEPTVTSYDDGPMARTNRTRFVGLREHVMPDLKAPQNPGKIMSAAFFITGQRLEEGATDELRRKSLAQWMTARDNPWFAKAFVNRLWAELVGEGCYEPVDDLGPDRRCSAPQTLEYLAAQFVEHNYDVKWLYRTITETDAYQRESRPRHNANQQPFAANVSQPLRADQLGAVLSQVLGIDVVGTREPAVGRGKVTLAQRSVVHGLFGFDPSIRRTEITASIPQALMLMNSARLNQAATARTSDSKLSQLLAATSSDDQAVVDLYLLTLAREPSQREKAVCLEHVKAVGDRADALEDLFWSLLNSEELRFRN